jgi:hypothetical protein
VRAALAGREDAEPTTANTTCGNGQCEAGESARGCPSDCMAVCGDGFCDRYRGESPEHCIGDCPRTPCGDGTCSESETEASCPADCCPAVQCGDGVCQAHTGENCITCPQDCAGSKAAGYRKFCCGAYFGCRAEECTTTFGGKSWQCVDRCDHR